MIGNVFRASGWVLVIAAIAIVLAIAISAMAIFGIGWFKRGTANFRGETEAIERVRGQGEFRLTAYNRFFDLCSAVQADEGRIDALKQELKSKPSEERVEQIHANITALTGSRTEKIRRYNADATKDFTVGQFRDADLPYTLNVEGDTLCALP